MSRVQESAFRVFYMPPSLIKSWRSARDRQSATTLSFIQSATTEHLPMVVRELRSIGLTGRADERCPVRLAVPLDTLADIGEASESTGVPGATLLAICLSRAATSKGKRRARRTRKG